MKSKFVKILYLCLSILAVICGCSNDNNKDLSNNLSKQESPIPPGLKKFTFQFEFVDGIKADESNVYKIDITLPDNWSGEQPLINKNNISFTGFTSLHSVDKNFKFINDSWKEFMNNDYSLEGTIPSIGTTTNSYEYIKYKYADSESYYVYIKVSSSYVAEFNIHLDGVNSTNIDNVLNSIYFYK